MASLVLNVFLNVLRRSMTCNIVTVSADWTSALNYTLNCVSPSRLNTIRLPDLFTDSLIIDFDIYINYQYSLLAF